MLGARIEAHAFVSFSSSTGSNDLNSDRHFRKQSCAIESTGLGLRADYRSLLGRRSRSATRTSVWVLLSIVCLTFSIGPFGSNVANGFQVTFAKPDVSASIAVSSSRVTRWRVGHYEVLHLTGDVKVQQQGMSAKAGEAILWVESPNYDMPKTHKVIAYMEGQVLSLIHI